MPLVSILHLLFHTIRGDTIRFFEALGSACPETVGHKCNTMSEVRQADDSFVCFGAKPDGVLDSRSRRDRKWVRGRESVGKRSSRRQLEKGNASDQSTPEQRDQSDEMRSRAVREDESR